MGILIDNIALEIVIIAAVVVLISIIVRKFTTDESKMERMQENSKTIQKEYNEAIKSGDEKRIKAAEEKYKELSTMMKEVFKDSMKPMMYTAIPLMIIFWLMSGAYKESGTVLTIPFAGWELNWFWWYFIAAIVCSIVFENVYKQIKKRMKK